MGRTTGEALVLPGVVHPLEGVVDQAPGGQQHFLAGCAPVLEELRREHPFDTLAEFIAGGLEVLPRVFRKVARPRAFMTSLGFSHVDLRFDYTAGSTSTPPFAPPPGGAVGGMSFPPHPPPRLELGGGGRPGFSNSGTRQASTSFWVTKLCALCVGVG